MWERRKLKKDAKQAFFANYWSCVAVCLILAFIVGAFPTLSTPSPSFEVLEQTRFMSQSNANIVSNFVNALNPMNSVVDYLKQHQAQQGLLAGVFNSATQVDSFFFGVLHAVNQFLLGNTVLSGILVSVGALLMLIFWLFVGNPLRVGACRFFIESHFYPNAAKPFHMLFLYKTHKLRQPVKIMLLKTLYTYLWFLTIVGGFVKLYAYRMIPYILAENPDISAKDAFALSSAMMKGNKWRTFLLDLSFLGWRALSFLTFGILGYALLNPYTMQTEAGLYLTLRCTLPREQISLLHAENGLPTPCTVHSPVPVHLVQMPAQKTHIAISSACTAHYSVLNLILIFFAFCVIGWIWEVAGTLLLKGVLVNRGTLYGPWLPIYGVGGVGVVILFRRFAKKPVLTFICVAVFCATIEFFTSLAFEEIYGYRWWDYTGYFLNLQGRICLEGVLAFALAGCASIYYISPSLNNFYNKISQRLRRIVAIILLCFFVADCAVSAVSPNSASLTYEPQPEQSTQVSNIVK